MFSNNGIAKARNGTFYVASPLAGKLSILNRQTDNTLAPFDVVPTGNVRWLLSQFSNKRTSSGPIDNLSVDDDGVVWGAGQ
jgi:arylesterase / paraoxonase